MSKPKPPLTESAARLPDPDDVLRVMLNTAPRPHSASLGKQKRLRPKKKPAK